MYVYSALGEGFLRMAHRTCILYSVIEDLVVLWLPQAAGFVRERHLTAGERQNSVLTVTYVCVTVAEAA